MISLHEPKFSPEDEALVLETLRSTWVSTGGPFVDRFETEFANYVGRRYAVSVSNGTIALQLAVEVLKRQRHITSEFDVITPTLSFIATSNAVFHAGGNPILIDCAPGSMNLDPKRVDAVIDQDYERTNSGTLKHRKSGNELLCIMPAHIMGWSCNMVELQKVADKYKLPIIEDAAEALGSRYFDQRHLGTGTLAATFSFNGNKIITTGGGGMIVTDDPEYAKLAKHLSTTAKTDGLRYVHDQVGYNFRMVNILAALGVSQLKQLPGFLTAKKAIARNYRDLLQRKSVAIHEENFNTCNHWIVNAVFASEEQRERAMKALLASDVQVRPLWTPAHRLPYMSEKNTLSQQFPNSDHVWRTRLSMPSSSHLTLAEQQKITDIICEVVS